MMAGARFPFYAGAVVRFYVEKGWPPKSSNDLWERCRDDYRRLRQAPHPRSLFHMVESGHRKFPDDLLVHLQMIYGFKLFHHETFEVESVCGGRLKDSGIRFIPSGSTVSEPGTQPGARPSRTVASGPSVLPAYRQSRQPRGKP